MSDAELEKIIKKTCSIYQVDPLWVKAIITTESSWNQYSIRYEVNYQYLFKPEDCAKKCGVTLSTEIATQKMSWGLGQTMGALAREQGHTGMLSELIKPEIGLRHVCIRLESLKRISTNVQDVFACYNGGPSAVHKVNGSYFNQSYVDRCSDFLKKLNESD